MKSQLLIVLLSNLTSKLTTGVILLKHSQPYHSLLKTFDGGVGQGGMLGAGKEGDVFRTLITGQEFAGHLAD